MITNISGVEYTFQDSADSFKQDDTNLNGMHWHSTYGVTIIPDRFFSFLINAAMPYKATASSERYAESKYYDELCSWLEENSVGKWVQTNIHFRFEIEEDALLFKLTWG